MADDHDTILIMMYASTTHIGENIVVHSWGTTQYLLQPSPSLFKYQYGDEEEKDEVAQGNQDSNNDENKDEGGKTPHPNQKVELFPSPYFRLKRHGGPSFTTRRRDQTEYLG